ncbi:serine phosphatase RsbU (regulator of sigma subunit) [Spinactinospora alkalitolerans]|uniref:protein-serine/threonine phosphatase n=1 Tax=Spinactinospora alkalitolerans TaxID=687207 RepID=A0A852U076_9ACTN|nr:SpoIIE family protein phosphatase [Spinactinospora alkalitolerans]NYE48955.1 serine phosphatase RsbU (regulator of sigma subunit) [Spinactinospora alkalitolerans]
MADNPRGADDLDPVLERALSRLMLIAEVSTVLSSSLHTEDVLGRLARLLVPQLADWCVVELLDEELRRVALAHRDPKVVLPAGVRGPVPGPEPLADTPLERVLAGAGPLFLDHFPEEAATASPLGRAQKELVDLLGADTAILAPLRARRRVLGVLVLVRTDPDHPLSEDDLPLVEDLTHRAALAVDNARLYTAQRDAAQDFQRALLPELPKADHLQMAARYTAAQVSAEVGGDWYDAFVLPDGVTALVAGDVSGHDRSAAVQMAQLRSMLRALAWDHQEPPSAIMRRLDGLLHHLGTTKTATALYGRIEGPVGGPWRWRWTNAGHPPPLLVTREGETRYLTGGHGLLLGVDDSRVRPDAEEELPPRSTLLLYTDGLIERRGESLHRGMTRLRRQAAALAGAPVGDFCDGLLEGVLDTPADDVVLLALRVPEAGAGAPRGNADGPGPRSPRLGPIEPPADEEPHA